MNELLEKHLVGHNIKPTSTRLLVLKAILAHDGTFSLFDLENELETVDKSTIFRALQLFLQNHLLHTIDDGSGSMKYAMGDVECECDGHGHSACECHHADNGACRCAMEHLHVHFFCTHCRRTYCLRDTFVPAVSLPPSFFAETANYVVKGTCDRCAKFAT